MVMKIKRTNKQYTYENKVKFQHIEQYIEIFYE